VIAPRARRRPRHGRAARAMLQLLAIAAGLYTCVMGFRITTALAAVGMGLSPAAIGPMIATFSLVPMILGVRGGRMIDRVGVRRPMIAGTLLCAAGAAACAALPHPVVLTLGMACVGLGMMGFHLGMQHAAGEIGGPARRTQNFNLLTMSFSVSGLLGPPAMGVVIDQAGHRAAFGVVAALACGVLLALRRFPFERHVAHGGRAAPQDPAPEAPQEAPAGGRTRATFALLGAPRLRRLLIASLLVSAAWDTYQFVLPLHAPTMGLSASAVGLAIAAFSAGSLTVRLLLPRLIGWMAHFQWMLLAMGLSVVFFTVLPFASDLAVLMALSFVVGIGPGFAQPLLMAALHATAPPGRAGEAAGLRLTLVSAMQLALPVCLGLLAAAAGTAAVFWLYAAVAAAVGAGLWRARGT
jgi:MFS family permease